MPYRFTGGWIPEELEEVEEALDEVEELVLELEDVLVLVELELLLDDEEPPPQLSHSQTSHWPELVDGFAPWVHHWAEQSCPSWMT